MDVDRLVKKKHKAKRDGNVTQIAQVSKELGDMYFETGRLKDALHEYNEQLRACEVLHEKLNCAIAHRMIGEVHASLGDYDEALTHQTLHLEGAKEAESVLEQQRAYATIGRTHFCQAQALSEESTERKEACAAAKKAYSKSLKLCNELENSNIGLGELMTMRARLLLNLGLVLEEQREFVQAIELIEKAAELFKRHKAVEDLHRTHIALGALHERRGHFGLALRHIDRAIEVEDSSLKIIGQLTKAELLLRLGRWIDARQLLVTLYLSKDESESNSQQIQRLLRIVVTICRAEENLEVDKDGETRQKLYETLGDAAAAVRSYEKALDYYKNMLLCAEGENSIEQISAALVSLVQTYRDVERYEEALPFARRELSICTESSEICRSALNLADLLYQTRAPKTEIMDMYKLAIENARECKNKRLEATALNEAIIYLEENRHFDEAADMRREMNLLGESGGDSATSENESESANIGDDICLEDLSDVEAEMRKRDEKRNSKRARTKRNESSHVIKRNAKGETKLHVACIAGNIEEVTKLLEANHPTNVRDHCGWTPLHEAANHGHVEIARLLIKSGANVNDPGGPMCGGVTPLHDAASCGHFSIMSLLMKNGGNLFVKTREGDTILDCLEAWKNRSEDLSATEEAEYNVLHSRLSAVSPKSTKKSQFSEKKNIFRSQKYDDDDDDEINEDEKISAGEDYRRTIENLKNRYRPKSETTKFSSPENIPAPLIDSEEILTDDWLEDDLNCTVRERTLVDERSSSAKRKSNDSVRENDKIIKRARIASTDNSEIIDSIVDDNSCDSRASDSSDVIFASRKTAKISKKRSKQLSLLKSGFTRDKISSRSPSPLFNYCPENSNNYERNNECCNGETIKLQIRIEDKLLNMKLRFPEQREMTVDSLSNDIVKKFEDDTGCKVQITLRTMSGDILLREHTLKNVRPVDGVVRLLAEIVNNEIPSIVDRYEKISKSLQIQIRESVVKCLKISDNTSTFRVKSDQMMDDETVPLLKCLEYQEKLQILQLSGTSLYDMGSLLNNALKRLATLQELHVQGCDINEHCLGCIERLPSQLRILDMSYNPLGKKSEDKLYNLISHNRHLQTLNLRFCKLTKFSSSDDRSCLVNIDLSWNPLENDVNGLFLRRQMLALNLSNTRETENTTIAREIIDSSSFSLRTLETLELACCNLTDTDVIDILSKTINLSKFIINGNGKLTKKCVETLLVRRPSLMHIDASGCEKIIEIPENNTIIDNPKICTLRSSMSSDVVTSWLRLWRGNADSLLLPHDVVTFVPIIY